ncbi:MAG: XdhC family protein [Thermoanaerobaculia bacterium]
MREMRQILARARALRTAGKPAVLATIVGVEGSAYRREGARMLIEAEGATTGVLSGGCLEGDLAQRAREVLASGAAALTTYDLRAPDEYLWGLGLGCGGRITLLLEPLPAPEGTPSPLDPFERIARDRAPAEIETRLGDELLLRETIVPPLQLLLAGAGRDAVPLATFADELGWETVVLDARPTAAAAARFESLARFAGVGPRELAGAVEIDRFTAAVVLTHNYLDDLAWLAALLPSVAFYVGLLGPAARRDRLLADLAEQGVVLDAPMPARLHGPAGLDLGGRAPEQVALAIVAEIQAAMTGASATPLSRAQADSASAVPSAKAARNP